MPPNIYNSLGFTIISQEVNLQVSIWVLLSGTSPDVPLIPSINVWNWSSRKCLRDTDGPHEYQTTSQRSTDGTLTSCEEAGRIDDKVQSHSQEGRRSALDLRTSLS